MARPLKQGLDYFPTDCSFYQDIKIRKLIKYNGGVQAVAVYHILLCMIYGKGYYMEWDDDIPFVLYEQTGLEEDYILQVINSAVDVGLFDASLYNEQKVLTSKGIQKRFFAAWQQAKRKVSMDVPYLLIELSPAAASKLDNKVISEETLVFSEETEDKSEETKDNAKKTSVNSGKSTQIKEKENKENISGTNVPSSSATTDKDGEVNFLGFMDFFNRTMQEHKAIIATITDMTPKRREAVGARNRKYGKEALRKVVLNAAVSPFLNGENDKSWVADFNWLFKPNNFVKVLEGNYNHVVSPTKTNGHGTDNNNGYRTCEDIYAGAARIIAKLDAEGQQPKTQLPVL